VCECVFVCLSDLI